jgi:hypothetical protein
VFYDVSGAISNVRSTQLVACGVGVISAPIKYMTVLPKCHNCNLSLVAIFQTGRYVSTPGAIKPL